MIELLIIAALVISNTITLIYFLRMADVCKQFAKEIRKLQAQNEQLFWEQFDRTERHYEQ